MGKPRNTQKYPEIPERKKDTRKYPIVFFDTPTRPATLYFVQYLTRPNIEKPYPLGTARKPRTKQQPRSLKHFLLETANLFAQTCIPAISATFSLSFNIFTTTTFSTIITKLLTPWNIRSASSNPAEVWLATAESAPATFSLLSTMRVFGG